MRNPLKRIRDACDGMNLTNAPRPIIMQDDHAASTEMPINVTSSCATMAHLKAGGGGVAKGQLTRATRRRTDSKQVSHIANDE